MTGAFYVTKRIGLILATDDDMEFTAPYPTVLHSLAPGVSILDSQMEFFKDLGVSEIVLNCYAGARKAIENYIEFKWLNIEVNVIHHTGKRTTRAALIRAAYHAVSVLDASHVIFSIPNAVMTADEVIGSPNDWNSPRLVEFRHYEKTIGAQIHHTDVMKMYAKRDTVNCGILHPVPEAESPRLLIIQIPNYWDCSRANEVFSR
jgi:hypothetical protein